MDILVNFFLCHYAFRRKLDRLTSVLLYFRLQIPYKKITIKYKKQRLNKKIDCYIFAFALLVALLLCRWVPQVGKICIFATKNANFLFMLSRPAAAGILTPFPCHTNLSNIFYDG